MDELYSQGNCDCSGHNKTAPDKVLIELRRENDLTLVLAAAAAAAAWRSPNAWQLSHAPMIMITIHPTTTTTVSLLPSVFANDIVVLQRYLNGPCVIMCQVMCVAGGQFTSPDATLLLFCRITPRDKPWWLVAMINIKSSLI